MIQKAIFVLSVLALTIGISSAEIYKWVDENGVTHYSDSPTEIIPQSVEDEIEEIQTPDPTPADTPSQPDKFRHDTPGSDVLNSIHDTQNDDIAVDAPTVEIYETSWCVYCKKAKQFFRSKGIDFIAYNIEKDPQAARRMMAMTQQRGVPFVVINGQGISGYSVAAYEQALQN
jgi:glutaredoxin-like YruB-family protein